MSETVGLLVIGNEILDGIVLDTNSQWVTRHLKALNLHVREKLSVRDEIPEIAKALRRLKEDGCRLIVTMGGLGPTHDDVTLGGVAEAFGLRLGLDQEALDIVARQYKGLHEMGLVDTAEITEARRKMALIPEGSRPLDNRIGGAPGVLLQVDGALVVCLPGVPKELMWIFENPLVAVLRELSGEGFAERIIALPLKDESILAPVIDRVMREVPSVYVKSMVGPFGEPGIRLWIYARGTPQADLEERVKRASELLKRLTEGLPRFS